MLFFFFFFIFLSILSAIAIVAVVVPLSRGLEYLFTKRFPWRRSAHIVALSTLTLTVVGTYVARLFIVVGERLRAAALDPFPGEIEVLLMAALVNTMFVLIAVVVAVFSLRKILNTADELEPRGNFDVISVLVVLSFFNFLQTMLVINNLIS